ncbi:hypothetical protein HPB49_005718 [Dermacentor silvarum]|uniref:Uncharacterized protein n=1 Tax=Dermacentor silvarum TaxID=543639 RepID=A0ACB8D3A9_DERSI|nr:hypothetical protein HPB49_005718 [Dermacentor silvarum]
MAVQTKNEIPRPWKNTKTPSHPQNLLQTKPLSKGAAGPTNIGGKTAVQVSPEPGISVLIGADYYWQLVSGRIRRLDDSLTTIESIIGWRLHGDTRSPPKFYKPETVRNFNICLTKANVSQQLRSFCEAEHLGLTNEERLSKDDEYVLKNYVE